LTYHQGKGQDLQVEEEEEEEEEEEALNHEP
jgi:hypothetical protein